MSKATCPVCDQALLDGATFCSACGHELNDQMPRQGWVFGRINVRSVARHHRRSWWCFLFLLFTFPAYILWGSIQPPPFNIIMGATLPVVLTVIAVSIFLMLSAMNTMMHLRFLLSLLTFVPLVNFVVLLKLDSAAKNILQSAGLKVGLMGVSDEKVVRFLGLYHCHHCGYSLVGNTSGRCPECGEPAERGNQE